MNRWTAFRIGGLKSRLARPRPEVAAADRTYPVSTARQAAFRHRDARHRPRPSHPPKRLPWLRRIAQLLAPVHDITRAILVLLGQRVLRDAEFASLYGVTTKRLNERTRRKRDRFPADFMFQRTAAEDTALRSQFATSKITVSGRGGRRYLPYAHRTRRVSGRQRAQQPGRRRVGDLPRARLRAVTRTLDLEQGI
jgi:hypothetical protein